MNFKQTDLIKCIDDNDICSGARDFLKSFTQKNIEYNLSIKEKRYLVWFVYTILRWFNLRYFK